MTTTEARILIDFIPVDAEDEDLETVALANDLLAHARQELATESGYVVSSANDGTRGDIIQVAGDLVQQAWANKELFGALFGSLLTTLGALSKERRVEEVQVSRGGETLVIKNVDRATAERMLREFDERTTGKPGPIKVTQKVSKRKK